MSVPYVGLYKPTHEFVSEMRWIADHYTGGTEIDEDKAIKIFRQQANSLELLDVEESEDGTLFYGNELYLFELDEERKEVVGVSSTELLKMHSLMQDFEKEKQKLVKRYTRQLEEIAHHALKDQSENVRSTIGEYSFWLGGEDYEELNNDIEFLVKIRDKWQEYHDYINWKGSEVSDE